MAGPDKATIEINYCVPCAYHGAATWMASEFFAEGGSSVAIKLTPGDSGILQVFLDGKKLYDKKEEGGQFPNVPHVKELRAALRKRLTGA
jgi:selenoprotein W-related protein